MAIKRTLTWNISQDGLSIVPNMPQDGGVQGEHNATIAVFHVAEGSAWTDPDYAVYIECEDNAGNIDATEQLTVKEGAVSYLLPLAWTQYGGIATLRLVAEQLAVGGDIVRSPDATVRFSARQNAQDKVDGLMKGRLAQTEARVKAAADSAAASAGSAAVSAQGAQNAASAAQQAANATEVAKNTAENAAAGAVQAAGRAEAAAKKVEAGQSLTVKDDGYGNVWITEETVSEDTENPDVPENPDDHECSYQSVVTKHPTCGVAGVRTHTCSVCGHSYTEVIPATNAHVYDDDADSICNICGHVREVAGGEEPDEPSGPTTVASVEDASHNHFVTLSGVNIGTEVTVETTGSKVFCYDGGNLFPTTELESSADGRLTVNADGSVSIKHYANIKLPFVLPAGWYTISAAVEEFGYYAEDANGKVLSACYPGIFLKNAAGTTIATGIGSNNEYVAQTGRIGVIYQVNEPLDTIQIFSANNNANSGGSLSGGFITTLRDFCMWYSPTNPVLSNSAANYEYKGDYCGLVYNVATETPIVYTDPMVMLADDFAAFSVRYGEAEAANAAPAAFMLTRSAPTRATQPAFTDVGQIGSLIVGNRQYTSFPDRTARAKTAELEQKIAQGGVATDTLPGYLIEEADKVTARAVAAGLDADLSFLVFADSHSFDENKYRKYAKLMENGGVDFLLSLGDINPYGEATKADCIVGMHKVISLAGRGASHLYVAGNHDVVVGYDDPSTDNTLTKKELHKLMCSHLNGVAHFNEADPYGCYYYVDYEAAKIRVIVLNTSDLWDGNSVVAGTYQKTLAVRQAQMDWFTGTALNFSSKTGWSVMVCAHNVQFTSDKALLPSLLSQVENAEVIGVFYGHGHQDSTYESNGIKCVEFRCDNAHLDQSYIAELGENGVSAGSYYIETRNGKRHGFTLASNYPDARYIVYNNYLSNTYTEYHILNKDMVSIRFNYAYANQYVNGMAPIATDFTARRIEGTATMESCAIVNINKNAGTITVVPYGIGDPRVVDFNPAGEPEPSEPATPKLTAPSIRLEVVADTVGDATAVLGEAILGKAILGSVVVDVELRKLDAPTIRLEVVEDESVKLDAPTIHLEVVEDESVKLDAPTIYVE